MKKIKKQHESYLIDKQIIERFDPAFRHMIPPIIPYCAVKNLDKLIKNMKKLGITQVGEYKIP